MADSPTQRVNIEKKYCPLCYQQFEGEISICPGDNAVLRGPSNDPLVGKVFADRYDVESVLGLGGMSIVYKAKHRLMDRTVAIKMLHSKLKEDVTALERFKLEAQAASSLSHQNIIAVYDFGVTPEGEPYFVMDCLEGESLKDLIDRKGKVPYERALPIFRQIADGLEAAHKKQIVHRDLKPGNVILIKQDDGTEQVKLVDFGIAKLLPGSGKAQQHLTQTGEVFGSPLYMSPEQCLGKELDPRSDIYAAGCLMYETLAGVPPFMGDSFLETMNKHVGEKPKPIKELAPDVTNVPVSVEQVIMKCLAKDPGDRFRSAGELRDVLSALTYELVGSTGKQKGFVSTSVMSTTQYQSKSHVLTVISVSLLCLLLGLIGFLALWPGPPEDRGTPLSKMMWLMKISVISNLIASGDYPAAERNATDAEDLARHFGDQDNRLEATLHQRANLYDKWEGHASDLEKVNAEINSIQTGRVKKEYTQRLAELDSVSRPTKSDVEQANMALRAEAQIPTILVTATKLYGRGLIEEAQDLLVKALSVDTKLLGSDSTSLAALQTKLADCYIQQRKFPQVRPLLAEATRLYEMKKANKSGDYVRALSKIGQFDLDQNNFAAAQKELGDAMARAKVLKNKELLLFSMRSYADFQRQMHKEKESQELLDEAAKLEKSMN